MIHETIKKNGINYGVVLGVISILMTTVIYAVNLKFYVSGWYLFLLFVLPIVIGIILLRKTKAELNNQLTFKEAFTTYFIFILIGILIPKVFSFILFNFIDPASKEALQEIIIENAISMMQKFGAPNSEVSKVITQMKEIDIFSIKEMFKSSLQFLLFMSVIGLIVAAFFKTKNPSQE
jgi:Protein of unknown function (DUF4199)